jgi:hypothetical protein
MQNLQNQTAKQTTLKFPTNIVYTYPIVTTQPNLSYLFCSCLCPCGAMEQENQHQVMIVHDNIDEVDDVFALKRKDNNNNLVADVVVTSSSTSSSDSISNGDSSHHHSNGRTSTIVTDPDDESSLQKEEEVEEKKSVDECNIDFDDDKEDCVHVGLGLVAEFVGQEEVTNGEVIKTDATFGSESSDILQNKYNVYFDKQQGTPYKTISCFLCTMFIVS